SRRSRGTLSVVASHGSARAGAEKADRGRRRNHFLSAERRGHGRLRGEKTPDKQWGGKSYKSYPDRSAHEIPRRPGRWTLHQASHAAGLPSRKAEARKHHEGGPADCDDDSRFTRIAPAVRR